MQKNRSVLSVLACIMALAVLLGGCGGSSGSEAGKESSTAASMVTTATEGPTPAPADPFGKLDKTVEITAMRWLAGWMGFDEGEDENNNWWSRMFLDQLNIKLNIVQTWSDGTAEDQKIAVAIATNDLPDIVPTGNANAYRIAKAGYISDMQETYDKFASPFVKSSLQVSNGKALKSSIYDGKLFAIPSPSVFSKNIFDYCWVRQDWLTKLGLQQPKTIEDVTTVAMALKDNKDKLGVKDLIPIEMHKDYSINREGIGKFILEYYGGSHDGWFVKDGKVLYGRIMQENKKGLAKLSEWHKAGLLAKDFYLKDPNTDLVADVSAGKVGIVFGKSYAPNGDGMKNLKTNNHDAEYSFSTLTDENGQNVKQYARTQVDGYTVVTNKCDTPEKKEAVMKLINMASQIFSDDKPAFITNDEYNTTKNGNMSFWNETVKDIYDVDSGWRTALKVREDLKNGMDNSANYNMSEKLLFKDFSEWKNKGYDAENWQQKWSVYKMYDFNGPAESDAALYDANAKYDILWGPDTDSILKFSSEWDTKYREYFISAITTGDVEGQFAKWVEYWTANGGADATKEVQAWYDANKDQ